MGKENVKQPVPRYLPVVPTYVPPKKFLGSPSKTYEIVCMVGIPEEIHKMKVHKDEGNTDDSWDITVKNVDRFRKILIPTIHTLSNLKPMVQWYVTRGPVHDKEKVVREKEHDYDIPLQDHVMQPLTSQTVHITPPDDNYLATVTNPILNKHLNEFKEEFTNNTRVFKKIDSNPINDLKELLKTYDYETFIQELLHQLSQSSYEIGSHSKELELEGNVGSQRKCNHSNSNEMVREFWSTVGAFDPFPSTDEPEKRPLKEFLIKFSVSNGQRPFNLDFKTFCSSTSLDYNNGKYVYHPTPEVVKKFMAGITPPLSSEYSQDKKFGFLPLILSNSNFSKDPSKVTDIELKAHMIVVNNQGDSVFPPPLVAKPKKGKSRTVALTLPKSKGHEASGALSKKIEKLESKRPSTSKKSPPKSTEGSEQSHLVSSGTVPDPQDLERDIQLASTDSRGNKQPLDRDITSTTSNEGMAKTMPHPEGSLGDKDSGGNIPPADMELIHTPIADPSGTALLLSDDELDKDSDEEEVLAAGDDMDEDPQDDKEVRTPLPKQDQPKPSHQLIKYLRKMSRVLFKRITEKQWEQHEEASVSYADLNAFVDQYYDENIADVLSCKKGYAILGIGQTRFLVKSWRGYAISLFLDTAYVDRN
ncbi:hypothetical protein Tco_1200435 [Tanacetum coccineum]